MKETINISISGISFVLEKDAHNELSSYLQIIESNFGVKGEEGREIIEDIESRIAELLLSNRDDNSKVVTLECLKKVIFQMGMPDSDDSDSFDYVREILSKDNFPKKYHKRIYRNNDGAKLGGVLNGLASYFATDVAMVRLLFILILIGGSFISGVVVWWTLIVYGVGWIIVPSAKTPLQKLEMQGKPITVSSLNNYRINDNKSGVYDSVFYVIGRIIKFLLLVIVAILAVLIIVLGISIFLLLIFGLANIDILNTLLHWNVYLTVLIVAIVMFIPVILLGSLFLNILFSTKAPKLLYYILIPIWIMSMLAAGVIVYKEIIFRGVERSVSTTILETVPSNNTIFIDCLKLDEKNDNTSVILEEIIRNNMYISFHESNDSVYRVVVTKTARGSSLSNAISNAEDIDVKYRLQGDTIYIPTRLILSDNYKQNLQEVSIDLYCPRGSKIQFTDDIESVVRGQFDREGRHYVYAPKCDDLIDEKETINDDRIDSTEKVIDSTDVSKIGISISKESINTELVDKDGKVERTVIKINEK